MGEYFFLGIEKIHNEYNDDASSIWKDNPGSATVIRRFLSFKGVGPKIATMAANMLVRDFKVQMKDKYFIDVSPDVQLRRVFQRLGFIIKGAAILDLIYCARELHPEYPGIFDLSCWQIGREWCHPKKPRCTKCYLNEYCPRII